MRSLFELGKTVCKNPNQTGPQINPAIKRRPFNALTNHKSKHATKSQTNLSIYLKFLCKMLTISYQVGQSQHIHVDGLQMKCACVKGNHWLRIVGSPTCVHSIAYHQIWLWMTLCAIHIKMQGLMEWSTV